MSKHIKFEKIFRTTNDDLMRSTVKQDGIILGYGAVMSVKEVEEWICTAYAVIEERKEDIRVAEASIVLRYLKKNLRHDNSQHNHRRGEEKC